MAFSGMGNRDARLGDKDDGEAPVWRSPLQYGMGDAQRAFVVEGHDAHHLFALPLQKSTLKVHSGHVEQHVKRKAKPRGLRHQRVHACAVGQVAGLRMNSDAETAGKPFPDGLQPLRVQVRQKQRISPFGTFHGHRAAKPSCGPGYHYVHRSASR